MESKFTVLAEYLALHILKRLCTPTPCAWPGKGSREQHPIIRAKYTQEACSQITSFNSRKCLNTVASTATC